MGKSCSELRCPDVRDRSQAPHSTVHSPQHSKQTLQKRILIRANSHSISSNLLDWLREGQSNATSNARVTHGEGRTASMFSLSNCSAFSTPYRGQLPQLQRSHQHPSEQMTHNQVPARGGRRNNEVIGARGWKKVDHIRQKSSHSVAHPKTHAASTGPAAGKVEHLKVNVAWCVACICLYARAYMGSSLMCMMYSIDAWKQREISRRPEGAGIPPPATV